MDKNSGNIISAKPPKRKLLSEDESNLPDKKLKAIDIKPIMKDIATFDIEALKEKTRGKTSREAGIIVQNNKPEAFGEPPVWSDVRQQLCNTLPYFKAHQSAVQLKNGFIYGFLCDKKASIRDIFADQVIISRIGGGSEDDGKGNAIQKNNKQLTARIRAFHNSKQMPIGMIVGQQNCLSPSKLSHYYSVLDWFHITEIWTEISEDGYKEYVAKFEKINLNERSWWSRKDQPFSAPILPYPQSASAECSTCHETSKKIYTDGWVCLNDGCKSWFGFGTEVDTTKLKYNQAFLNERTAYAGNAPGPLTPSLLTNQDMQALQLSGYEEVFRGGFVCPNCKGCSRRVSFDEWFCEHANCCFTHRPCKRAISVKDAIATAKHKQRRDVCKATISSGVLASGLVTIGKYTKVKYTLLGDQNEPIGYVDHYKADDLVNSHHDGPNELFIRMQLDCIGLQRYPAYQKGAIGEMLTSGFTKNYGANYEFGVETTSQGFDEAPDVIIKAVKLLEWAAKNTAQDVLEPFYKFNECLAIAYMEKGHINYHDDGESTVGPTVASLSLGASATMKWRRKHKSGSRDLLKIRLDHGDIMVMHGEKIQKLYEHAVDDADGILRFALTSRHMKIDMMKNNEERENSKRNGSIPDGVDHYDYDGGTMKATAKDIISASGHGTGS